MVQDKRVRLYAIREVFSFTSPLLVLTTSGLAYTPYIINLQFVTYILQELEVIPLFIRLGGLYPFSYTRADADFFFSFHCI